MSKWSLSYAVFLLLWLRSLSARRQAIKTRRRRLQEARRRINRLRNRAKKRSALLLSARYHLSAVFFTSEATVLGCPNKVRSY